MNPYDREKGRGSNPNRGRERGSNPSPSRGSTHKASSSGSKPDKATVISVTDPLYEKVQQFIEQQRGNTSQEASYAQMVESSPVNSVAPTILPYTEHILYLEPIDLQWEKDPWYLMEKYFQHFSYSFGSQKF